MIDIANIRKCEERLHRLCFSLLHQMEMTKQAYKELLKRPEWKRKRMEILNRDGHRCTNCGNGKNLQTHHRQYNDYSRTGKLVPFRFFCSPNRLNVAINGVMKKCILIANYKFFDIIDEELVDLPDFHTLQPSR
jgi:hypothetical protein